MKELKEIVLKEYEQTKDKDKLQKYIHALEKKSRYWDAFELCEAVNDAEGMQRIAREYFVESIIALGSEDMLKKSGVELNPALYNERASYWFMAGHYNIALEAFIEAGNRKGIKKTASKLEKSDLDKAFKGYLAAGDKESAYRMAKEKFIWSLFTKKPIGMLREAGYEATKELWEKRAEFQLGFGQFENALEAYEQAGNKEGMDLVKKKLLE